jgi:hypothetical protein
VERFYDPDLGEVRPSNVYIAIGPAKPRRYHRKDSVCETQVLLDGRNIRTLQLSWYRQQVRICMPPPLETGEPLHAKHACMHPPLVLINTKTLWKYIDL